MSNQANGQESYKPSRISRQSEKPDNPTPSAAWKVSLYHLLILIGAVITTFWCEAIFGIEAKERVQQGYALAFGALGGAFAASRYVVYSVRHNIYDRKRLLWQILTPIYSAVLAWVGVIALGGGILILAASPNPAEPRFTFFIMGFAFLVGFASESFSKRLIMAAQTLFGEHGDLENGGASNGSQDVGQSRAKEKPEQDQ